MKESEGNKILRQNLPKIVDYFSRVYGEEYRDIIQDRLDNTIFVFMDLDKKDNLIDGEKLIDIESLIGGDIVFEYIKNAVGEGVNAAGNFTSAYYDNPTRPVNICVLPETEICNDAILIHEIGHIIESDVKLEGKTFKTHTGFMKAVYRVDIIGERYKDESDQYDPVRYQQLTNLNEVINDYMTLKVVKLMQKQGFQIFDNEITSSLYSLAFPALQDFFDRVAPHLIKSGFIGRVKDLPKLVGGQEFNLLLDDIQFLFQKYGKERLNIEKFFKDNNLSAYSLMREKDLSWLPENIRGYIELLIEIENHIGDQNVNELVYIPRDDDEREL